ncbi:MAG: SDR family NAD(P)-dependent oxidoreductase [Gammaproteobacteria bacterium]
MAGKTVLITGSTDGLGREVALRLGAMGAQVLVHGRNRVRGEEVVKAIQDSGGSARFYQADFASLDNVRKLAQAVIQDHPRLDVLINNAGIGSGFAGGNRQVSEDGYEMIFQVNYLSHYLLTDLLLPLLKASAPARIINVASGAQRPVDFDDVMLEDSFTGRNAYGQSKLAQILHTFHISEMLEGTDVTFNTLHPASMMDTTMVAQMDRPARTTVDEGARALMNLVVSRELEGRSGLYFRGLDEDTADDQAYDPEARERLDSLSRRLVGLPPR